MGKLIFRYENRSTDPIKTPNQTFQIFSSTLLALAIRFLRVGRVKQEEVVPKKVPEMDFRQNYFHPSGLLLACQSGTVRQGNLFFGHFFQRISGIKRSLVMCMENKL